MAASLETLREELVRVDESIAVHPFNSPESLAIRAVVEEFEPLGNDRVNRELSIRGLPSLEAHGAATARSLRSFGKLHRQRRKLLRKIERRSG